jgi:hypothetical protein
MAKRNDNTATSYSVQHPELLDEALKCARGSWQRSIVMGEASASGADLQANQVSFQTQYVARSLANLQARLTEAGFEHAIVNDRLRVTRKRNVGSGTRAAVTNGKPSEAEIKAAIELLRKALG